MTKITTDFVGTESTVVTKSRLTEILAYWGASTAGYTLWGQARTDLNYRLLNTTAGVIGEEELAGSFLPKINFLNDPDAMIATALFGAGEQGVWFDPSDVANLAWRRNLMLFSRDPFAGVSGVIAKANAGITAPTGDQYVRLTELSGAGTGKRFFSQNLIPVAGNMTFSFYAKENVGGRWISFRENTTTGFAFAFQPSTGTVSTYAGGASPANVFVQLVAAGVYRVSFVINFGSTAAQSYSLDMLQNAGQSNAYVGDGVSGYDLTSVQFESGSIATEYQPITDLNTEVIERFPNATMYQNAAGTIPVYAPGQPVGLRLDKSKGLVLGPELVTNGDFSAGTTGWVFGGPVSATVTGGEVEVAIPDGAVFNNTSSNWFSQGNSVMGKLYEVSFDATYVSGGSFVAATGFITKLTLTAAENGGVKKRYTFKTLPLLSFEVGATRLIVFGAATSSAATWRLDNISVKELPGNHATQSTDISRPLYGIEPAGGRRNLLTYTEQFENAAWEKSGTAVITANQDGVADLFRCGATAASEVRRVNLPLAAASYTFSVFAKAEFSDWVVIQIFDATTTSFQRSWFNIRTGVVGSTTSSGSNVSFVSASMTLDTDGYYRCKISATLGALTAAGRVSIFVSEGDGVFTGTASSGVLIWGAQLEVSPAATPYQKVVGDYEVTEAGVQTCHYCNYDGTNDGMLTNSIDFTATDKMSVFAAVRKNNDVAFQSIVELSTDSNTVAGSMFIGSSSLVGDGFRRTWAYGINGSAALFGGAAIYAAPSTNVITGVYDIAAATRETEVRGRADGSEQTLSYNSAGTAGTGNFGNYPIYLGRRGGSSAPFSGRDYGIIVTGKLATSAQIGNAESFLLNKLGSLAPVITGVPTIGVN